MTKLCFLVVTAFLAVSLIASNCYGEGLSTLAAYGKVQEKMQKVLDSETKAFNAVKKGIENGSIKKGQAQDYIEKRYGKPVIAIPDKEYPEKWVYKPGYATWFDGIKIYLYFDQYQTLMGVKIINAGKKK